MLLCLGFTNKLSQWTIGGHKDINKQGAKKLWSLIVSALDLYFSLFNDSNDPCLPNIRQTLHIFYTVSTPKVLLTGEFCLNHLNL